MIKQIKQMNQLPLYVAVRRYATLVWAEYRPVDASNLVSFGYRTCSPHALPKFVRMISFHLNRHVVYCSDICSQHTWLVCSSGHKNSVHQSGKTVYESCLYPTHSATLTFRLRTQFILFFILLIQFAQLQFKLLITYKSYKHTHTHIYIYIYIYIYISV